MAQHHQPEQWKAFVEGGLAAMSAAYITHPLDTVKVRMQLQGAPLPTLAGAPGTATPAAVLVRHNPLSMALQVVRTEGASALLRGVSASVLRQGVYSSTRLGIYDVLKNKAQSSPGESLSLGAKIGAGLFSGAVGSAVGNPADVVMVRMQADGRLPEGQRRNYRGLTDAFSRIVRDEGVFALWRGCSPTVTRAMVVTAAQVATYDQCKEAIVDIGVVRDGLSAHVAASAAAGLIAAGAAAPFDLLKTRLMEMKAVPGEAPPYAGMLDCASKLMRQEGPLALFKGLGATLTRQAPFTMLLFIFLEQYKALLNPL